MIYTLAALITVLGFAWLALAMEEHWRQVRNSPPPSAGARRLMRILGALALLASLLLCLRVDYASMAVLVWVMYLVSAALLMALILAWRPRLLSIAWPVRSS